MEYAKVGFRHIKFEMFMGHVSGNVNWLYGFGAQERDLTGRSSMKLPSPYVFHSFDPCFINLPCIKSNEIRHVLCAHGAYKQGNLKLKNLCKITWKLLNCRRYQLGCRSRDKGCIWIVNSLKTVLFNISKMNDNIYRHWGWWKKDKFWLFLNPENKLFSWRKSSKISFIYILPFPLLLSFPFIS